MFVQNSFSEQAGLENLMKYLVKQRLRNFNSAALENKGSFESSKLGNIKEMAKLGQSAQRLGKRIHCRALSHACHKPLFVFAYELFVCVHELFVRI